MVELPCLETLPVQRAYFAPVVGPISLLPINTAQITVPLLVVLVTLTWNENLSTLEYQWHIRVGLTNPRKGNKSVVYISTYRSKTRHALATLNLAAIKTIIERAKRSSHF